MNTQNILRQELAEHLPHIRRIVYRVAKNKENIDDVSQECCVRILSSEQMWDGNTHKLKQWMNAISHNLSINWSKKNQAEQNRSRPLMENTLTTEEDNGIFTEEQVESLINTFQSLPPRQKEILNLRFYKGKKMNDIALELDHRG